jgi:hypothetical protein
MSIIYHRYSPLPTTKSSKRQATFSKAYSWLNLSYLSTYHANQNLIVTAPEGEKALMASIASSHTRILPAYSKSILYRSLPLKDPSQLSLG